MPQALSVDVEASSSGVIPAASYSFAEERQLWFKNLAFHLIRAYDAQQPPEKNEGVYTVLKLLLRDELGNKINAKLIEQFRDNNVEIQNYIKSLQYIDVIYQLYFPFVAKIAEWEKYFVSQLGSRKESDERVLSGYLRAFEEEIGNLQLDPITANLEDADFFLRVTADFREAVRSVLNTALREIRAHEKDEERCSIAAKVWQIHIDMQIALEKALEAQKQKVFEKVKAQNGDLLEARSALADGRVVDAYFEYQPIDQATQQAYFEDKLRMVTDDIWLDLRPFQAGGDIAFVSERMLELYQRQLHYLARVHQATCERSIERPADCEYQPTEPYTMSLSLEHQHLTNIATAYFAELRFYFFRDPTNVALCIRLRERYGVIATTLGCIYREMTRIVGEVSVMEGYRLLFPAKDQTVGIEKMGQELSDKYGAHWQEKVKEQYRKNFAAHCDTLYQAYQHLLDGSSTSVAKVPQQNYWALLRPFYENLLSWLLERSELFTDFGAVLAAPEERKFEEQKRHYLALLLTSRDHFQASNYPLFPIFQHVQTAHSLKELFILAEQHVCEGKVRAEDCMVWKEWVLAQQAKGAPKMVTRLLAATEGYGERIKVIEEDLVTWKKNIFVQPVLLRDLLNLAVRYFREGSIPEKDLLDWKEAVLALQKNFAPKILEDLLALAQRHFEGEKMLESSIIMWKKSVLDLQAMFGASGFLAALLALAENWFASKPTTRKDFIAWKASLLAVQDAFGYSLVPDDLAVLLARHCAKRNLPQERDDPTVSEPVFAGQENFWPKTLSHLLALAEKYFKGSQAQEKTLNELEEAIWILEDTFCQFLALHGLLDLVKRNFHFNQPSILAEDAAVLRREIFTTQQASQLSSLTLEDLLRLTEARLEKIQGLQRKFMVWQEEILIYREQLLPFPEFLEKLLSLTEAHLAEIRATEEKFMEWAQRVSANSDSFDPKSLQDLVALLEGQFEKIKLTEEAFRAWRDSVLVCAREKLNASLSLLLLPLFNRVEEHRKAINAMEKEIEADLIIWKVSVLSAHAALTQANFLRMVAPLAEEPLIKMRTHEENFVSWREQVSVMPAVFQPTDFLNSLFVLSEAFLLAIREQKTDFLAWKQALWNAQETEAYEEPTTLLEDLLALVARCLSASEATIVEEYRVWEEAVITAQEAAFEFAQFSGTVSGPSSGQSKVLQELRGLARVIKGKQLSGCLTMKEYRDFQADILAKRAAFAQFMANTSYLLLKKARAEWLWILSDRTSPTLSDEHLVDDQGKSLFAHILATRHPVLISYFILYLANASLVDDSIYQQLQPLINGELLTTIGVLTRLTEFKATHAKQLENNMMIDIFAMKEAYDRLWALKLPELDGLITGSTFAKSVRKLVREIEAYFLHCHERIHPEMARLTWVLDSQPIRLTGGRENKTLPIAIYPTSAGEIGYAFWQLSGAKIEHAILPQEKAGDEYGASGSFRSLSRALALKNQRAQTRSTLKMYEAPLLRYMERSEHLEEFWITIMNLFDNIRNQLPSVLDQSNLGISAGNDEPLKNAFYELKCLLDTLLNLLRTRQLHNDVGGRRLQAWIASMNALIAKYHNGNNHYVRRPDNGLVQAASQQLKHTASRQLETFLNSAVALRAAEKEQARREKAEAARKTTEADRKITEAARKTMEAARKTTEADRKEQILALDRLALDIERVEFRLEKATNATQKAALEPELLNLQKQLEKMRATLKAGAGNAQNQDMLAKLSELEARLDQMRRNLRGPAPEFFGGSGSGSYTP